MAKSGYGYSHTCVCGLTWRVNDASFGDKLREGDGDFALEDVLGLLQRLVAQHDEDDLLPRAAAADVSRVTLFDAFQSNPLKKLDRFVWNEIKD